MYLIPSSLTRGGFYVLESMLEARQIEIVVVVVSGIRTTGAPIGQRLQILADEVGREVGTQHGFSVIPGAFARVGVEATGVINGKIGGVVRAIAVTVAFRCRARGCWSGGHRPKFRDPR
jgi:hypothetical protein